MKPLLGQGVHYYDGGCRTALVTEVGEPARPSKGQPGKPADMPVCLVVFYPEGTIAFPRDVHCLDNTKGNYTWHWPEE